ncbi:Histone-lysine N-methyltransferase SMYD3 [Colletotrichum gloeosporioides]|uniref:Histone-lysine N-methyltransferase SMYD3 n=1 Tax=Colletotrichum gloeosporioides TaxID=474922 RepID=A0A8H4FMN8_COLGL|nr:Histone-lysine N-methyltransferase SMYD3 [Colletotrichum gloeosporioides]KAF3807903.1 Histone-lysine N-methyltransferase SMYD3 [Colletotrichum gloeosporioides]
MHLTKALSAFIYTRLAFCFDMSTLYTPISGHSSHTLALYVNDTLLCPVTRGQPEIYLSTPQNTTLSNQQSTCIWSDSHSKQYCIFSNPHFDHGKGITVITTPERILHIAKSIASAPDHHLSLTRKASFRTSPSGSKGRGIFATRHIPAGSLITEEPPIILLDRNWVEDISSEEARASLQALAIAELPRPTRQTVDELFIGTSTKGLKQKIWTNGYGVSGGPAEDWPGLDDEADLGMIAVHANISKINHSCRSNAASQWDWDLLAHRLWAVRDIAAGEEITISYFDPIQTPRERQHYSTDALGFKCACSHCQAPSKFAELSDDRVNEIHLLQGYLETREIAPAEPTAMAELLVNLYKQEGLDSYLCKAYAIAAREWNGAGYEYQARSWAYQSVEAGLVAGSGTGMEEYVRDMESLLDGARKHWSWRYRLHV